MSPVSLVQSSMKDICEREGDVHTLGGYIQNLQYFLGGGSSLTFLDLNSQVQLFLKEVGGIMYHR